jgi:4-hydroxy-3-polyprenylbenzoate decarboxylase
VVKRVIIGITGSTGVIYGIRLLQIFQQLPEIETHLVISRFARQTITYESELTPKQIEDLADVVYRDNDLGAAISSGSFRTAGMIVAPCSVKTLSGIANSYGDNLMVRAADVCLKERRPLVLLLRETPLHLNHLRLATRAAEAGAIIFPPVPAFYTMPQTIMDIVDQTVGRALDQLNLGLELDEKLFKRWEGTSPPRPEVES